MQESLEPGIFLLSNGNVSRLDVNPTEPGSTTVGLSELYLRCESCHSPHSQGLGLGLYITRQIVNIHKGTIDLVS